MESYNHPLSDIIIDRTSPPMISTPILRRQIAFEQDSKMSPPLERERKPYSYHPPTNLADPASDQIKTGSTMDLDPSDKEATESSEEDHKDPKPEPTWIRRITDEPALVGEPDNFSGKGEDTTRWLMAMKAYFGINQDYYNNEKKIIMVFLNKLTKERAGTFAEGWYMKLNNPGISDSEITVNKLYIAFEETFVPRDIVD